MQVLVLNSGSSSIKYRVFGADLAPIAGGLIERIGEPEGRATHEFRASDGSWDRQVVEAPVEDHAAGFRGIIAALDGAGIGDELGAIGHRVVHGGATFSAPTLVDDATLDGIRANVPLAPLHNPANLLGIEVARDLRPQLPQVAVFDTAFHATLPEAAYRYALPRDVADEHGIRRYGFHGTSHAYVAGRAAAHLGRPLADLALITLHLGNGASVTAIDGGRSVETSMGLTPLEGLVMGTRSGDLDPAVVLHLQRHAGLDVDAVDTLLNRSSGLRGLCGDNDLRTVEQRAADGDADAQLALDVYVHRIRRYLGAYAAVLGRLDAIVFTAGVGENADTVRAAVCADLDLLGIEVAPDRNAGLRASAVEGGVATISPDGARVAVLVVATDEEREIAAQTRAVAAR